MRPTIGFVAMALLCLAGSGLDARTMRAPPPAGYAVGAMSLQAPTDGRASQIDTCVADAPVRLPNGTNATAFCTCAVDKMLTHSTPQLDAVNQCATEMRITLRNLD
jgi:hypothetical protein